MNKAIEQRRKQALAQASKGTRRVRKPRVQADVRYKPGRTFGRQHRLLKQLQKGEKVFVSTLDVEMTLWRFEEATGKKIELTPTFNDGTIYKLSLV